MRQLEERYLEDFSLYPTIAKDFYRESSICRRS